MCEDGFITILSVTGNRGMIHISRSTKLIARSISLRPLCKAGEREREREREREGAKGITRPSSCEAAAAAAAPLFPTAPPPPPPHLLSRAYLVCLQASHAEEKQEHMWCSAVETVEN